MAFLDELRRRNVVKVAALYVVTAWLVLQVADVLLPNLAAPGWAFGMVLGLLVLGFPVVLIFAWVFELTPDGLRREEAVGHATTVAHGAARKINVLIVAMLALAIGVVVVDRMIPESASVPEAPVAGEPAAGVIGPPDRTGALAAPVPERSIAVLPFADMSPGKDQAYLSDGLAEELLNLLARVPELRVASRTSAFSFKGRDVKLADLAAELNVTHVLEGSVRKSGDRVRITAQLVAADTDTQVWVASWDRTLDDVFAIQDEIASTVVAELKVTLLGESPTAAVTDPRAYTLFLQARHVARQMSADTLREAVGVYRRVLEIDPDYVPAWLGLGAAYSNLAATNSMPSDEAYPEALRATRRALALNADSADAYAQLGWAAHHFSGDYAEAARDYQRALELDPNNDRALNGVAALALTLGHIGEAIRIQRLLIERDPVSGKAFYNIGLSYFMARDVDAARAAFDKALSFSPDMTLGRVWRGLVDYVEGDYDQYLERFDALSADTGIEVFRLIGRAVALPLLGRDEDGAAAQATLERDWGRAMAYVIATIHARQLRTDRAFDWLHKSYDYDGPAALTLARMDPFLDSLHGDPRWQPLLEKAGLSDRQVSVVRLPDQAGP